MTTFCQIKLKLIRLKSAIACAIILAMKNQTSLNKNDEIVVTIERLGSNGEGIALYDGAVIFVPFALIGEKCLVHIVSVKKNFYFAKLVEKLSTSKARIDAPCPYFVKCGGCDIQHMSYVSQLELKRDIVKNELKKFAGQDVLVPEVISSEKQFRYRNKFAFPVQEDENGKVKIGMFRRHSHDVVEIDDCMLQSEKTAKIINIFKKYMKNNNISAFNEEKNTGIIKHIVVRENENSFILTVIVSSAKFNNFEPLICELKKEFESFGVYKNINTKNNNVIFGDIDEHIYGLSELEYNEFGIKYFVNNRSFLQVNDYIKNQIYSKIIELLGSQKNVVDAYSGAGLLSSIIAKTGANVYGIEIIKEATLNAENLKKINNLNNLTNINGDCAKELPKLAEKLKGDFVLVVDPPRKGLDEEVVSSLLKSKPQKIIYLSCNPSTLARDIKLLSEKYQLNYIQPYDMFPQTANVETLICLNLK